MSQPVSQLAIEQFLDEAPPEINSQAILDGWRRLQPPFLIDDWILPLPPWRLRPYIDSGPKAWSTLQDALVRSTSDGPISIYMHIPFCTSKCGFCDSYSFKLANHRARHVDGYTEMLTLEMRMWSQLGNLADRPVSTVHFGGGTPTFLGPDEFAAVIRRCADYFYVTSETEWAVESTVFDLTSDMMSRLHQLGFRRLHLGVQSMEDHVRALIGRRRPAHDVLTTIEKALGLGWIVSVDLICGLPGQTLRGFLDGIRMLAQLGTDGFSVYELLIYPQNRRWAESHGLLNRNHLPNYLMFVAGCQLLEQLGYRKNLFNHWANERDDNRYFTFPARGEDLLAVGAIADGVFGNYHYRHFGYQQYGSTFDARSPGLEGGLRRTRDEEALRSLTIAILSGVLPSGFRTSLVDHLGERGDRLLHKWEELGLVTEKIGEGYWLTASGSWFAGNLLGQLTQQTD